MTNKKAGFNAARLFLSPSCLLQRLYMSAAMGMRVFAIEFIKLGV